jgi:hypothetical protein
MATIDLITYDQKLVTPKDDALIHQFGISNGVLYGCEVTLANSNTLHITGGQGVIYGRQWEIAEGDITVTLPASGTLKGRLYVKIDLSNTTNPIELLVQTDVTLPDLTDDDQLNVNNSVSELELYTFDVSSLTISNLVRTVETVADGDHADVVQLQSDVSQLNSSKVSKVNTQLTLTRTSNNYVDAASFARLAAVRKDNVLFFICNLALSSSIPASALSDFVEIGRISGWSSAYTIMQQIPSQQSDGNSLSIRVTSNGIVSIYAVKATSSWYRTVVSIPASN